MAKDFTFRGKTLPELQQMPTQDFAKLCKARVRRSLERSSTNEDFKKLFVRVQKGHELLKAGKLPVNKPIKTTLREFPILPQMVGLKIAVHRGNTFEAFDVQPEMLGHRLGEYILTRKTVKHGKAGIGASKSSTAITAR